MTDIKETKIYHSYILTALAKCYYNIEGYSHALELITRTYEIQNNNQNLKNNYLTIETLELLALVSIKLKCSKEAVKAADKLI